jgi:uncharacterized protein
MMPDAERRLAAQRPPPGFPVMHQRWAGLLFLHWPIDPEIIQQRLPTGLFVDTYEGKAWLGVVPFFMQRVRPSGLIPLPWLSWFHELNVRTYVHDAEGNPGVWFFSLDCNQAVAVEIARRGFHLPYVHASMSSQKTGQTIHYQSRRKSPDSITAKFTYDVAQNTQPAVFGSLEWFLVERYLLFSSNPSGQLFCGRVQHSPYQISATTCTQWSTEPLLFNHFDDPGTPPPSILSAAPVDVKIFPLRRLAS